MSARYVAERGSGSAGTAYNLRDWEIIDTSRRAGRRVMARATQSDARLIVDALNDAEAQLAMPRRAAAE